MIKKIIHRILKRRHFWRDASFSEVAELYASRMLRMMALSLSMGFISIYLYQNGYSVLFITVFWACFYLFKSCVALPAASFVAKFGPKHGIFISNLLFIPAMIAFAVLPSLGAWVLLVVAFFQGISATLYSIAYNVDFSKVKSIEHAGKEIAYMNIVEKITTGLSPLIGGVVAFLVGPQIVLVSAAALFALAALPLMKTAEPVHIHQKLKFKGLPWRLVRRVAASEMALGFDVFASGIVWSLFTAITIIGVGANNEVYITNGILISVILFAALAASYAFGKLIDKRRGGDLMMIASVANSLSHLARPFIASPVGIAGLNVANETATTGYVMAYTRGSFDNADLSGARVTYLGVTEVIANFGAALAAATLALLVSFVSDERGMQYFFFITAAVVLLVATARFPLYRR